MSCGKERKLLKSSELGMVCGLLKRIFVIIAILNRFLTFKCIKDIFLAKTQFW